jgi:integrase
MKQTHSIAWAVDYYLHSRRQLGFALKNDQWALTSLVRYAKRSAHRGPLTASLATRWAQLPTKVAPPQWARRLNLVRRFAQFWQAFDPRTEVPAQGFFGPVQRRRPVHIYTTEQIRALLAATSILGPTDGLRAASVKTLLALLACTGLRVSEALGLGGLDIDWSNRRLIVRQSKSGQGRLIPVQDSTLAALRAYEALRKKSRRVGSTEAFFVSTTGRGLPYETVHHAFGQLRRHLGWTQSPVPRLQDLRHTFAVNCLINWYEQKQSIGHHILSLSTYLGHRQVTCTYWYLSAVPQLLAWASRRFQSHANSAQNPHE